MKSSVLIELPFLPSIEYMQIVMRKKRVCFEAHESFQKQSHRNRAYILGANGILTLTIPVSRQEKKKTITEVQIDNNYPWKTLHLKTVENCYKSTPYFEHYIEDFIAIYNDNIIYLWDFNMRIWRFINNSLGLEIHSTTTHEYIKSENINKNVYLDCRNLLSSQIDYKNRSFFTYIPYSQLFGTMFTGNLSIIDLIFNKGPEGLHYL